MSKYASIENAFQKIKQATGNTDVREMVNKFLTREQMYAVLRNEVNEKECEYEKLQQANEVKKARLHQLQIENDIQKKDHEHDKCDGVLSPQEVAEQLQQKIATADDSNEADFLKLSHDIAFLEADLDKVNNRKKNISLINDQVGGWTRRVGEKLNE